MPDERPSVLRGSSFLLGGQLLGLAASSVLSIVAVRTLSLSEFSRYSVAITLVTTIGSLLLFGVPTLVVREVSAGAADLSAVAVRALAASAVSAALAALVIVPIGVAAQYPGVVVGIAAIGISVIFGQAIVETAIAIFTGRSRPETVTLLRAVQGGLLLVLGIAVLMAHPTPALLAAAVGTSWLLTAVVAVLILRSGLSVRGDTLQAVRESPAFLRAAASVAVITSAAVVYGRIDVLLLSKLDSVKTVALYSVPLTLVEVTLLLPGSVYGAYLPQLVRRLETRDPVAVDQVGLLLRLLIVTGGAIALVLGVAATSVMRFLFGETYTASGPVLAILAGCVVANFVIYVMWAVMLAGRGERRRLPAILSGLVLNVGLNVVLIPAHGPKGAAIALLVTDALMAAWLMAAVHRSILALPLRRILLAPALVGGVVVVICVIAGLTGIGPAIAASFGFAAALTTVGYVSRIEWATLVAPIRGLFAR